MNVGYDQSLYLMPFDHRESIETKMFDREESLNAQQTAEVAAAKREIYDGFLKALADGAPRPKAGILVDEQFGRDILRDASERGIATACPVEKSGQKEFVFEYGDNFARRVETVGRTTFWDPLVGLRANRIDRDAAVAEIARRYRAWVDLFENRPSA